MELNREHYRAMIFYDFKDSLTRQQCAEKLKRCFGDEAPSYATVKNWYNEFQRGRTFIGHALGGGRPETAVTEKNIDAVRRMIETDHRVTYEEIRASLGIGMSQVQKILHEHLRVRKLCARWIPHNLTDAQKVKRVNWCKNMIQRFSSGMSNGVYDILTGDETWIYCYDPETKRQSTQWVFPGELKPLKVMRSRSVGKKMVATFCTRSGHVATIPLEGRKTVNAEWYTTICLPIVLEKVRERRPHSIILHHDNASAHTAGVTSDFLATENVELLTHPPYSPDLAPCDFFVFPAIKEKLRGKSLSSSDGAVNTYGNLISEVPADHWALCFQNWFQRMKKVRDL